MLFPYVPCGSRARVAIEEATPHSTRSIQLDDTIGRILDFQPLLEAFEEFCRKALCSEVRHNLDCSSLSDNRAVELYGKRLIRR